jgi:vacuolar-type H+-ATPase subunit F/Vma7
MESGKHALVMASPDISPLFETLGFSVYPTDEHSPRDLYDMLKDGGHNVGLICISETIEVEETLQDKLFSLDIPLIFFPEQEGSGGSTLEALVERAVGMKPDFLKE